MTTILNILLAGCVGYCVFIHILPHVLCEKEKPCPAGLLKALAAYVKYCRAELKKREPDKGGVYFHRGLLNGALSAEDTARAYLTGTQSMREFLEQQH